MRPADLTAAECLRMLLEAQAHELALLRTRAWEVASTHPLLTAEEWSGLARQFYNQAAADLSRALVLLAQSLEEALAESTRAVATLSGRVG